MQVSPPNPTPPLGDVPYLRRPSPPQAVPTSVPPQMPISSHRISPPNAANTSPPLSQILPHFGRSPQIIATDGQTLNLPPTPATSVVKTEKSVTFNSTNSNQSDSISPFMLDHNLFLSPVKVHGYHDLGIISPLR